MMGRMPSSHGRTIATAVFVLALATESATILGSALPIHRATPAEPSTIAQSNILPDDTIAICQVGSISTP